MIDKNDKTLKECVKMYNNSYHRMIGMKPTTMLHDSELEEAYISKCIFENRGKIKKLHEEIKPGMKVRYVLDKNANKKIRYKLSPDYYIVDSIDNFKAGIMAKDGYVKSVPLFRIVKLKPSETRVQFAETIEDSSRGVINKIIDYNTKNKTVKAEFKTGDGGVEIQTIPLSYIRDQYPTRVSDLEMEFLDKHPDEYKLDGRYITKIK